MIEVLIFKNSTFQEIPEQDNPATEYIQTKHGMEKRECIMIFKGVAGAYRIPNGGFVVANVPKTGGIILRGVFWLLEDAIEFADRCQVCPGV